MIHLPDADATAALGARIAAALGQRNAGLVMMLDGELGTGKTTLVRATLAALGHVGIVVSPTYTLLESYAVAGRRLHHLDLYRLSDPGELVFIGVRDLDVAADWFMIEWAGLGAGHLPAADVNVQLSYAGAARNAVLQPQTAGGAAFMRALDSIVS